ncbi:hypothetical protein BGX28_004885 [Mortierella sp. GBA30]|nr:hypothetical protein BGX28_004885 [Mortierella sp. GBA30]
MGHFNVESFAAWMKPAFRITSLTSTISTMLILPTLKSEGLKTGFGRGTQYLTILSLILSIVCLSVGTVEDLFKRPGLTRLKYALLTIVVPAEFLVAVMYWYLTLQDVLNIYPDGNRYLPFWLDIQMHGLAFVYVLVEMFYYSSAYEVKKVPHFIASMAFGTLYVAWSSICATIDGEWCPWQRFGVMMAWAAVGVVGHVAIAEVYIRSRTLQKAKETLRHDKILS